MEVSSDATYITYDGLELNEYYQFTAVSIRDAGSGLINESRQSTLMCRTSVLGEKCYSARYKIAF